MMNFIERLTFLLEAKRIKQAELADYCDIRPATISDWKTRGTLPSSEIAIKIAKRLDVSLDFLLTGENKEDAGLVLSPEEEELLSNYRQLSEDAKSMINIQIAALAIKNERN